jgi:hypothetical protein
MLCKEEEPNESSKIMKMVIERLFIPCILNNFGVSKVVSSDQVADENINYYFPDDFFSGFTGTAGEQLCDGDGTA